MAFITSQLIKSLKSHSTEHHCAPAPAPAPAPTSAPANRFSNLRDESVLDTLKSALPKAKITFKVNTDKTLTFYRSGKKVDIPLPELAELSLKDFGYEIYNGTQDLKSKDTRKKVVFWIFELLNGLINLAAKAVSLDLSIFKTPYKGSVERKKWWRALVDGDEHVFTYEDLSNYNISEILFNTYIGTLYPSSRDEIIKAIVDQFEEADESDSNSDEEEDSASEEEDSASEEA